MTRVDWEDSARDELAEVYVVATRTSGNGWSRR